MKRLVLLLVPMLLLGLFVAAPASAAPAKDVPPPLASTTPAAMTDGTATRVAATTNATIGWSQYFGSGYGTHPVVASNRNPSWTVTSGNPYLVFQSDCNLVLYSTNGGGAFWASNSVAGLRPCLLDFQLNADIQIRNSASQLGWHTNVIHSGTVYAALALYDSGCLVEYYYNAPTQKWLNQWRTNLTGIGIDCASYTA